MLPRWHILLGAALAILFWIVSPSMKLIHLLLFFFSSFLIDFDHYVVSLMKTKKFSLRESFKYHEKEKLKEEKEIVKGIRKKGDFHLFHTIEFHFLVGIFGFVWVGFFYVFMGMVFHSLLDVIDLLRRGAFHRREYFFFGWWKKRFLD